MAIYDLINQLAKTLHDIIEHEDSSRVLADIVVSAEDVLTAVPEASGAVPAIVADVINVAANIMKDGKARTTTGMDKTTSNNPLDSKPSNQKMGSAYSGS